MGIALGCKPCLGFGDRDLIFKVTAELNRSYLGLVTTKPVFGSLRTTKVQTSLGIRAD